MSFGDQVGGLAAGRDPNILDGGERRGHNLDIRRGWQ